MENFSELKLQLETELSDTVLQLESISVLDTETGDWEIRTDNIDQTEADENSQADAAEEADERIAILAELENRYRLIMYALKKLELGTYGVCEISGMPIEYERLKANPAARTCVEHMNEEGLLPKV